jgi:hypothetical protein
VNRIDSIVDLVENACLSGIMAQCGAITLIQRFGSVLNFNIHFHMIVPDGVYLTDIDPPYLRRVHAPTAAELQALPPALLQQKCYRLGVVASAEMLPAIAPATMASPLPRRGYGHQDDAFGADRTDQRSPATLRRRNRR